MSDMAYSMEYRGLKALERLVNAVDAFGKMGAVNNVYACQELHEANKAVRELFGLEVQPHRPRPMTFNGKSDLVAIGPDNHGELHRDYSRPEKPQPQPSKPWRLELNENPNGG